jgi:hypothetical protein
MAPKPGIVITKDTLSPGLKKFPVVLATALDKYMDFQAPKVQDYARSNAPWTDRTSNARNGLFAQSQGELSTGRIEIRLYHTVPYGIWLEIRWAGKYATIYPTIVNEGQRIMGGLNGLLSKMGFLL